MPDAEYNRAQRARLIWRCRRGTLELDHLLSGFLKHRYDRVDGGLQAAFVRLLDHQDPVIIDWLAGNGAPEDGGVAEVVAMIRRDSGMAGGPG